MGRIYQWRLTRMSDAHGSTVYYRHFEHEGQLYVQDIHYLSPASCAGASVDATRACAEPLSDYGAAVRFDYEARDDVFSSYVPGWRTATAKRLRRVTVTAADASEGARYLVRRYHLTYDPQSYHSLLSSVTVEGRPDLLDSTTQTYVAEPTEVAESALTDAIVGRMLPPMTFTYSAPPTTGPQIPGFGGVDSMVRNVVGSPPHSVNEDRADFFDVNSDGLPDLLVTDPARYRTSDGSPAVGVFFNGFSGADARPAAAGTFSAAVPVGLPAGLSGTMSLSNLNIVPMDIDGDGRSDLLHMPRRTTYGWFAPVRDPEPAVPTVSPAQQGWHFAYAERDLSREIADPRIDLGRDSPRIQVLDVNNDHLVDVVRTTGTPEKSVERRRGSTSAGCPGARAGSAATRGAEASGRCRPSPSSRACCTTACPSTSPTPR
jgi:hypothetical protein